MIYTKICFWRLNLTKLNANYGEQILAARDVFRYSLLSDACDSSLEKLQGAIQAKDAWDEVELAPARLFEPYTWGITTGNLENVDIANTRWSWEGVDIKDSDTEEVIAFNCYILL